MHSIIRNVFILAVASSVLLIGQSYQSPVPSSSVIRKLTATCDPASVSIDTVGATACTVSGIASTDFVIGVQSTSVTAGCNQGLVRVTGTNTVTLYHGNVTDAIGGASCNPPSETWTFFVVSP